jgi:hypothetical protein
MGCLYLNPRCKCIVYSRSIGKPKEIIVLNQDKSYTLNYKLRISALFIVFCLFLSGKAFSSWPEFPLSNDCFPGTAYASQSSPAVAFGGTNYLVVWEDERVNSDRDIFGARVSASGEVLDPISIPICVYTNLQTDVKVAGGNQNYLVVWTDYRNGNYDIYGARVDFSGNVLDPDGFPISDTYNWESFPDVAWDGTNFFVVWTDDRSVTTYDDIYGARVSPQGEVLDPDGIQISNTTALEETPAIAYNGSVYLVAWEHARG